jgi:hypothetical protein
MTNFKPFSKLLLFVFLQVFTLISVSAQDYDAIIKDAKKVPGYFTFYWNENKGKVYLEVEKTGEEFLYFTSLAQGIGSNDIGLDRGRLGNEHVVKFERLGNKLMLLEPNYYYRAISNDPLEKKAVEESFAKSIHFGFDILAQSNGKFLVDLTPFLLRDAVGAIDDIAGAKQGSYNFDAGKSGIYAEMCKSFPKNTEFQAVITLTGTKPGQYLRSVVPTPEHVTMHQHHSFVKLPDAGFKPRVFDPRIGYGGIEFFDYSSSIDQPIVKKFVSRHRLSKKDPNSMVSEPVEPIVYYLDSGVPEPIRSALFEGATWWNQAFEAAGYKNAFQVKMLPPDADPMDIRYNLVQWVHRSTRGWSYGASIIDPRTGEILKGKVTLGSLRVRQDYLIAQGLTGDFSTGKDQPELTQMSLDRLKQLSAHEIGHTLGLPHNYIASIHGRASVMDYPHPLVALKDGKIDLSNAYSMGIGEYDKTSIQWGYQDFPASANEKEELEKIVQNMHRKGLVFLTDQDARPDGSVHPQTHLWDNGSDPVGELSRVMEIRKVALSNFNESKIPAGTPMANLEEVLVPMYMFHRFQTQAAAKVLGGAYYTFAVKGDPQVIYQPANADEQIRSLDVLMKTLRPEFLAVPPKVLTLIPPRAFRYGANAREVFKRHTGLSFDPLGPVEASAQLTLSLILNPERASRLSGQQVYNTALISFSEVLDKLTSALWKDKSVYSNSYHGQIRRVVAMMYLSELIKLNQNSNTSVEVKANTMYAIEEIKRLSTLNLFASKGYGSQTLLLIKRFEENPGTFAPDNFFIAPDGQPIDQDYDWLGLDCYN